MSDFKPTKPGWYWVFGETKPVIACVYSSDGILIVGMDGHRFPLDDLDGVANWLGPVVALEDGPGINAIQRQCLGTALPTTTLEYCLLGLACVSGEVMAEVRRGWTDEQIKEIPEDLLLAMGNFIEAARQLEWWKKRIRSGEERPLPPLSDACKEKIVREIPDNQWYGDVILDRCGVKASEAAAQRDAKLQARKAAGTLAATGKREGDG